MLYYFIAAKKVNTSSFLSDSVKHFFHLCTALLFVCVAARVDLYSLIWASAYRPLLKQRQHVKHKGSLQIRVQDVVNTRGPGPEQEPQFVFFFSLPHLTSQVCLCSRINTHLMWEDFQLVAVNLCLVVERPNRRRRVVKLTNLGDYRAFDFMDQRRPM